MWVAHAYSIQISLALSVTHFAYQNKRFVIFADHYVPRRGQCAMIIIIIVRMRLLIFRGRFLARSRRTASPKSCIITPVWHSIMTALSTSPCRTFDYTRSINVIVIVRWKKSGQKWFFRSFVGHFWHECETTLHPCPHSKNDPEYCIKSINYKRLLEVQSEAFAHILFYK